ncbi:MAG: hypothetical protein CMM93_06865 [Rickettsiales bacterium]|nr:hypothetical protein [Rickettsiales bacterium]
MQELNLVLASKDVLTEQEIEESLLRFKPVGPTDTTLFNNFVEDRVLLSFHNHRNWFKNLRVQLMDFPESHYTYSDEMQKIRYNQHIGGDIKAWGVILNTLRSDGKLSKVGHWVAMFADFRRSPMSIEYFNSSGRKAPAPVFKWMEDTAKIYSEKLNQKVIAVNTSNVVHQKSDTECGAYAMYYIAARLSNIDYKKFREDPIPDSLMTQFRSKVLNDQTKVNDMSFLKANFMV